MQQPPTKTELNNKNFNDYDDKYLYYERKLKKIKSNELAAVGTPNHHLQQQQMHHNTNYQQGEDEFFYWQNNKHALNLQDNELSTASRKNIYPSYKKKIMHYDTNMANNTNGGSGLPQSGYMKQPQGKCVFI